MFEIKDLKIKDILSIGTAYGILQVLAQDLGIKTGKKQRDLIQKIPVQIFLLYSAAFTVTNDYYLSFISTSIYYILKYIYSDGKTSSVCFEDV